MLKNLLELFNEEFKQYHPFFDFSVKDMETILTNESKCAELLNKLSLDGKELYFVSESLSIIQGRARHSLISYFLGLSIRKFENVFDKIYAMANDNYFFMKNKSPQWLTYYLWFITSANHDYGYYTKFISKKISIQELHLESNVLRDEENNKKSALWEYEKNHTNVLKNSYLQIQNYYLYSQKFLEIKNRDEKNDHGILGGLLFYNNALKKFSKENEDFIEGKIYFHKTSCLTICQHNIFKSDSPETDQFYGKELSHLYYDSNYFIDEQTPLLFLLSLADSIECVKKFSRKENDASYLETKTVLKNIFLEVSEKEIFLDFGALEKIIQTKKKEVKENFESYLKSLENLSKWMKVDTKRKGSKIHIYSQK